MNIAYLKTVITSKVSKYPDRWEEVMDLFQICIDNIEDGGSEAKEVSDCLQSIDDLLAKKGFPESNARILGDIIVTSKTERDGTFNR